MKLQKARHDLETEQRHIHSVEVTLKAESAVLC